MTRSQYSHTSGAHRRRISSRNHRHTLPVVSFSHRPWGAVWQRPQHILTRFAISHQVYFVEEPVAGSTSMPSRLNISVDQGVTILTPILPSKAGEPVNFGMTANAKIREMLAMYFSSEGIASNVIAWYTAPMAYGALPEELEAAVTVYDVMDESAAIASTPIEYQARDRKLMQEANLVFCSGPSLHEDRKYRHPRAFCFPSGVEIDHFRYVPGPVPEELANFESSVVGYYGMIDDRIDFDLIERMAESRPEWDIVMIGPKDSEQVQTRKPPSNVHYLGERPYKDLPRYLRRFDAAILPYAVNDVTQYISPTKTLEYLAGGTPVVSTPIRDVVELYGDVVEFGETPQEFVGAIEMLWNESDVEKAFRRHLASTVLAEHNWDVIAARMLRLIHDVVAGRSTLRTVVSSSVFPPMTTAPRAVTRSLK